LYVLVVIEHHSRRLSHFNVTAHPTAQWARQQLREAVGYEERYEYLLHDRDSIFSAEVDGAIQRLGLRVLKSPPRSPKANSICERVLGTLRRECLDWLIPLSESHLRQTLKTWVAHCNRGRPHSALGPGVPDPPANSTVPLSISRHRLDDFRSVHAKAILAGLHHEYSLARVNKIGSAKSGPAEIIADDTPVIPGRAICSKRARTSRRYPRRSGTPTYTSRSRFTPTQSRSHGME
jgi:hypothetical protein